MDTAHELLKASQNYLDGLDKRSFRDKANFYVAEALRNRLRAFRLKPGADTVTPKKKGWPGTKKG